MNLCEIWRIYPYNDNYEVFNMGRVRRAKNLNGNYYGRGGLLKPQIDGHGYLHVVLYKDGKPKTLRVHRLVLETFVSKRPHNMECNHKDGIKTNNRLDNLEWIIHSKNIKHAVENRLYKGGEKHCRAKLTKKNIIQIRKFYKNRKHTCRGLGEMFGVNYSTVGRIVRNETWKHL